MSRFRQEMESLTRAAERDLYRRKQRPKQKIATVALIMAVDRAMTDDGSAAGLDRFLAGPLTSVADALGYRLRPRRADQRRPQQRGTARQCPPSTWPVILPVPLATGFPSLYVLPASGGPAHSRLMSEVAESARNIAFLGQTDNAGRGDCVQVMVARGHAYMGTRTSRGIAVADVRDPRAPRPVNWLPVHPNSWCLHVQAAEDFLLVIEELDLKALLSIKEYYGQPNQVDSCRYGARGQDFSAGMRVYDIKDPANPRPIGFLEVEGLGLHRIWWTGGRYAYASALLDGYTDHILLVIDMRDPSQPVEAGRWWIPGMHAAGGETPSWTNRVALHHAVVADGIAYGSWRDGGLTILDVTDPTTIRLIAHRNWSPPFGGGTHSALPLHARNLLVVADEAVMNIDQEQMKRIWMFDIRAPHNPVSIATFPVPAEQDYVARGGQFGPHNLHENRPGSFVSDTTIFATYQSAGVRVYDIANPFRPAEIGHFVPTMPTHWMEPLRGRARMRHTADIFVSTGGLIYATDYDAGLCILEWEGA